MAYRIGLTGSVCVANNPKKYIPFSCISPLRNKYIGNLSVLTHQNTRLAGKSTVSEYLKRFGAHIIDADKFGWKAYDPHISPETYKAVVAQFGDRVLSKREQGATIDRSILRQIVFNDGESRHTLNRLVWPRIQQLILRDIEAFDSPSTPGLTRENLAILTKNERGLKKYAHLLGKKIVVIEAAVLLEAQWHRQLNLGQVWTLAITQTQSIERLQQRNGFTKKFAKQIVESQLSNSERAKVASVVIRSGGPKQQTQLQVERQWRKLLRSL